MKKSENKKFNINTDSAGTRLDIFLSAALKITRSQIQKMIETNQIMINNKIPKKTGLKLSVGDNIVIDPQEVSRKETNLDTKPEINIPEPKIIAETNDYVVVEKPTGMLTHPTMANEKNTLVNFLLKKYPKIKSVGDDPLRPGIVHRLDKEASGLLVVARTQKMFNHLKEQFKNRTIEKEYLALAHGHTVKEWDEINFPIARSSRRDRMAAIPLLPRGGAGGVAEDGGKEAKTEFTAEQRFVNFTLLRVKIFTGRMHQIRAHFLAYNHPLVGDPLYKQKKRKHAWDDKLGRLFLHSAKLGFTDLQGEKQTFESKLPVELSDFLKQLR